MLINRTSIFGDLQNNISNSMQLNIYLSEKISLTGNFNNVYNNYEKEIGKNNDIICDSFICEDDSNNNDLICK